MDLQIDHRRDNKLLGRTEISATIKHERSPTPKRTDARDLIMKGISASQGIMIIRRMSTIFGRNETRVVARHYLDREKVMSLENRYVLERNGLVEKRKREAKQAPAKKQ